MRETTTPQRAGAHEIVPAKANTDLAPARSSTTEALAALAAIPEESLWLESQRSLNTRAAYRNDVAGFMSFLGIKTTDELRLVERASAIAYQRQLETAGIKPAAINRKLAALSSLFGHMVHHQVLASNPCREIKRPRVNRRVGTTPAFSAKDARKLVDAPDPETVQGLRDRAILSVGLQAGPRRASIVSLKVRDFHQDCGFDCLRFIWKGGHEHVLALHPQTAQRIRDYLAASSHGEDREGPLFRPVRPRPSLDDRRHLEACVVNYLVQHYARKVKIRGTYTAHSMRATFITVALDNGASLEEVQRAAGHADPDTTKLYDRRGYSPEKSAAFVANY